MQINSDPKVLSVTTQNHWPVSGHASKAQKNGKVGTGGSFRSSGLESAPQISAALLKQSKNNTLKKAS
jgi:hypothetical protein